MFRRFLFIGAGVLTFIGMLAGPGQLYAQHGRPARGAFPQRVPSTINRGFNPNFRRTFTPGFGFTPGFPSGVTFAPSFGFTPGFSPNFNRGVFDPRLNRMRFNRFDDRFEDRFERRFGFSSPFGFGSGFPGGFVPGFGFVPGTSFPFTSLTGLPIGISFGLFGLMVG
jgi:hypothetical protein